MRTTVYIDDELLAKAKAAGMTNLSHEFQMFIWQKWEAQAREKDHTYARSLMPRTADLEEQVSDLAIKFENGGLAADSGPIAIALAVIVYENMVDESPDLKEEIWDEWMRVGVPELVKEWT